MLRVGVLVLAALVLAGCAWGGVSVVALVAALLLGLGVGCTPRSLGADDDAGTGPDSAVDAGTPGDAGTPACGQGACGEYMACVTKQQDFWCLPDVDGDGVPDDEDNCVWLANPDQADFDNDGWGDACDLFPEEDNNLSPCGPWCMTDEDGDGVAGTLGELAPYPQGDDNCPLIYNPDQADGDGDGVGDACDLCPNEPNIMSPCGDPCLDSDADGIPDVYDCVSGEADECPGTPSAGSGDYDADGVPDVCDPDGIPPVATRALGLEQRRRTERRALLERYLRDGVLDAVTVRTALG
jgi:hypothetical protein